MNVFGEIAIKESPKIIKLNLDNPFETFKSIYHKSSSSFLLESMESDSGLSRYSMIGFQPQAIIRGFDGYIEVINNDEVQQIEVNNPFDPIKDLIKNGKGKNGFRGGLVGYVSYEAARHFSPIKLDKNNEPDFEFGLYLDGIIFNHIKKSCEYLTLYQDRSFLLEEYIKEKHETDKISFKPTGTYYSKSNFEKMVLKAKEHIEAGDIFQSVLSNATEYSIKGDKLSFYKKLRKINPSPYMYHLKMAEREIIGSSPEMLVRIENRNIETFPIAGTRPRGLNPAHDKELENELLKDEKELAEHLMLVDLARNDIGKVSKFGTVTVPEYLNVKKFSHVQHIVSRVNGELKSENNAVDAFSSIFPAGTVSGAPKIRAMQIIDELESNHRGPYAGAVGYFALNGNADFAITIRTLICKGNNGKIQAGAGIVHDSIPDNEFEECKNKTGALISAME